MAKYDRTKLDYILNPENRLYQIEFVNGVDLSDGFLCKLYPTKMDTNDRICDEMYSRDVYIEVRKPICIQNINIPFGTPPWEIEARVHFSAGELTNQEQNEVLEYLRTLSCLI